MITPLLVWLAWLAVSLVMASVLVWLWRLRPDGSQAPEEEGDRLNW